MNKKGVSPIIATMVIIIMVMVIAGIAYSFVSGLIQGQIEGSESCFGNFQEVSINKGFTCEDTTNGEVQFFISLGDLEVSGILVSLEGVSGGKSFKISNGASFQYLKNYGGVYGEIINVPGKNSGTTYVVDLTSLGISGLKSIKIAPEIGGNQCEVSDSISAIGNCALLS